MAIVGSFFQYLQVEDYCLSNPVALIRQKSQFVQKRQGQTAVRRLSEPQWRAVINTAELLAEEDPKNHERTLFMISAFFCMYLRISKLATSDRWTPTMNDFHKDHAGRWWFTTAGKGNKERQVAVSDTMLVALRRWRRFQGLIALALTRRQITAASLATRQQAAIQHHPYPKHRSAVLRPHHRGEHKKQAVKLIILSIDDDSIGNRR